MKLLLVTLFITGNLMAQMPSPSKGSIAIRQTETKFNRCLEIKNKNIEKKCSKTPHIAHYSMPQDATKVNLPPIQERLVLAQEKLFDCLEWIEENRKDCNIVEEPKIVTEKELLLKGHRVTTQNYLCYDEHGDEEIISMGMSEDLTGYNLFHSSKSMINLKSKITDEELAANGSKLLIAIHGIKKPRIQYELNYGEDGYLKVVYGEEGLHNEKHKLDCFKDNNLDEQTAKINNAKKIKNKIIAPSGIEPEQKVNND